MLFILPVFLLQTYLFILSFFPRLKGAPFVQLEELSRNKLALATHYSSV